MKYICIVGAGQVGSRHLQGLKKVAAPLHIYVVDPNALSLKTAQERYESIKEKGKHVVEYIQSLDKITQPLDIAIIATASDVRRKVIENLLKQTTVQFFILEKLLFQKSEDYFVVEKLLRKNNCRAWVNCSMRMMPFYAGLKKEFSDSPFQYIVTGNFGLITTIIHYIDHIAYLSNCDDYRIDTSGLAPELIPSKRKGFFEMKGTIRLFFKNGTFGSITSYSDGNVPLQLELLSNNARYICWEEEQTASISLHRNNWKWKKIKLPVPFQSKMTNHIIEDILQKGDCQLTQFDKSSKIHKMLLAGLLKFLNKHHKNKFLHVPFT